MFIAWRGSSRREGPDSRAQREPVDVWEPNARVCVGLIDKTCRNQTYFEKQAFFLFCIKFGWNFFWISCVSYGVKQGCESHGCGGSLFVSGLGLSCYAIPLMAPLLPALP